MEKQVPWKSVNIQKILSEKDYYFVFIFVYSRHGINAGLFKLIY